MSTVTRIILMPSYLMEFTCTQQSCIDNCCKRHSAIIDENTYGKYKSLDSTNKFKATIDANINRYPHGNLLKYGFTSSDAHDTCCFLKDNLCTIHTNLGVEHTPGQCKTYPGNYIILDDAIELSCTLGCPETAKLALDNEYGIALVQIEKELPTDFLCDSFSSNRYFWDVRIASISILQSDEYSVEEKLTILSLFYSYVDKVIETAPFRDPKEVVNGFISNLNEEKESILNSLDMEKNFSSQQHFNFIVTVLFQNTELVNNILYPAMQEILDLPKNLKSQSTNVRIPSYQEWYDATTNIVQPFLLEHSYLLENAIFNLFFGKLMPYGKFDSSFHALITLSVYYSSIQFLASCLADKNKGLSKQDVILIIQKLEKHIDIYEKIEFSKNFGSIISDFFVTNDFSSSAYIHKLIWG